MSSHQNIGARDVQPGRIFCTCKNTQLRLLSHAYILPSLFLFFVIIMSREGTSYYVTPNKINAHDDDTAACIYPIHMAVAVHACTPVHVHEASYIYGHAGRMDDG